MSAAVALVIYLIVAGLVFWLLNFLVDTVITQEPFHKVAKTILIVLAVLVAITMLMSFIGTPIFR